jgi:2',3'-cyclic-nucleotide 2'-phosphodiesterase (5'-nucleotidase family)
LLRAATRTAAAEADVVVVMMHWGTEYATCADAPQTATATALEADGADVVVGGHAHRLQGGGWLGRSYVGYALGNFVWWRSAEPEARSGVLTLTVDAQAARDRGRASGAARRTASSLITSAAWAPLLIGTDGVPRPPADAATTTRLRGIWDDAVACSGLRATAG